MTEANKPWKIPDVVRSIMVVGTQTCCASFHSMYDLKSAQMNVQHGLIQELMHYEFELGHNTTEIRKNICCVKGESAVDHGTVTRWCKNFHLGSKDLSNQARTSRLKTEDSEAMLQAREANSTRDIFLSSVFHHLHVFGKSMQTC